MLPASLWWCTYIWWRLASSLFVSRFTARQVQQHDVIIATEFLWLSRCKGLPTYDRLWRHQSVQEHCCEWSILVRCFYVYAVHVSQFIVCLCFLWFFIFMTKSLFFSHFSVLLWQRYLATGGFLAGKNCCCYTWVMRWVLFETLVCMPVC